MVHFKMGNGSSALTTHHRGAEHPNVERKLREFGAILGAVGFSSRLDSLRLGILGCFCRWRLRWGFSMEIQKHKKPVWIVGGKDFCWNHLKELTKWL